MAGASSSAGLQRWELENDVMDVGPEVDAVFKYDEVQQSGIQAQKPWSKDPHFFKQYVTAWEGVLLTLSKCVCS